MQIETYKEGVKLYNSQNTSHEMLKANFVIRLHEYKKLWKAISTTQMLHPEQHYIVQGVRGSGKTTLLSRLALEVEDDPSLSLWLIPIVFKEEEYGITSLFSLWERVCEELGENNKDDFKDLLDKLDTVTTMDPKQALNILDANLSKANKKVILFIDNIVELLDNFNPNEQDILREVLITNNNIRLIGGSAVSLEGFYEYKAPFYQFFNVVTLKGLKKKETITLLTKLSEHHGEIEQDKLNRLLANEPQKIESIRRLTGGIPRTLVILFNILMDGPKGETFRLLEETIDQTTPLYKHRMDDLSKQQKPIVNAIALHWDAISAKEIADKTHLSSKQVSAQLGQLEKQWIIEKIPTNTKNNLYALKERFFNIWYLMRYGRRQDRKKVVWLTRFFEIWCSNSELKDHATKLMEHLKGTAHPQASLMFANALICSSSLDAMTKESIFSTMTEFLESSGHNKLHKELLAVEISSSESDEIIDALFKKFFDMPEKADQKLVKKLISLLEQSKDYIKIAMIQLFDEDSTVVKKSEIHLKENPSRFSNFVLAAFYYDNNRFEEAPALLIPYKDNDGHINKLLANTYNELQEYEKAEKCALKAMSLDVDDCEALLSSVYFKLEKYKLSEKYALEAIQQGDNDSYVNLAFALFIQKQYQASIDAFIQLMKVVPNSDISPTHCALGMAYENLNLYELAEASLKKSLNLDPLYKNSYIALASMYMKLERLTEAEVLLTELMQLGKFKNWSELIQLHILKKDITSLESTIVKSQETGYLDSYNLAAWACYENKFQSKKALEFSSKAILLTPNVESFHTHIMVALWNNNFEIATEAMIQFLTDYSTQFDKSETDFIQLFTFFLAKGQTNLVDKWLKEYQLTERLKPLYYALMSLMRDKYPNEILRMGGELKETVDEILLEIKELAKKYK